MVSKLEDMMFQIPLKLLVQAGLVFLQNKMSPTGHAHGHVSNADEHPKKDEGKYTWSVHLLKLVGKFIDLQSLLPENLQPFEK